MTVDMLAAAFIWPEEMLIGRTHIGNDVEQQLSSDARAPEDDALPAPDATPFWAALVRRFRAEAPASRVATR